MVQGGGRRWRICGKRWGPPQRHRRGVPASTWKLPGRRRGSCSLWLCSSRPWVKCSFCSSASGTSLPPSAGQELCHIFPSCTHALRMHLKDVMLWSQYCGGYVCSWGLLCELLLVTAPILQAFPWLVLLFEPVQSEMIFIVKCLLI